MSLLQIKFCDWLVQVANSNVLQQFWFILTVVEHEFAFDWIVQPNCLVFPLINASYVWINLTNKPKACWQNKLIKKVLLIDTMLHVQVCSHDD